MIKKKAATPRPGSLPANIRAARQAAGLTQAEALGEAWGIAPEEVWTPDLDEFEEHGA